MNIQKVTHLLIMDLSHTNNIFFLLARVCVPYETKDSSFYLHKSQINVVQLPCHMLLGLQFLKNKWV